MLNLCQCRRDLLFGIGVLRLAFIRPKLNCFLSSMLQQYTGTNCETEVSCEEVECLNHGRCISEGNDHPPHCSCPAGWSGSFCEDGKLELFQKFVSFFPSPFLLLFPASTVSQSNTENCLVVWYIKLLILNKLRAQVFKKSNKQYPDIDICPTMPGAQISYP